MGKTTGFLDYVRTDRPCADVRERVEDFREFKGSLPMDQRREQGGRCMNCGVPFCQSEYGCPLHNLIPEWNDEIFAGNMNHALSRLLKTNNFPEFTGRVCPALCENACVCGLNGDPVTVRDNELAIIERAWDHGLMTPRLPALRTDRHVAVIGSGPSGLAVADQLCLHSGIDMTAPAGTPIYATGDGVVRIAGRSSQGYSGYGVVALIDHGYGYQTLYAHMRDVKVRVGQKVKRGEQIGTVGSSGMASGNHLHYEVIQNGNKVDPVYYFFNDLTPAEYEEVLEQARQDNQSMS